MIRSCHLFTKKNGFAWEIERWEPKRMRIRHILYDRELLFKRAFLSRIILVFQKLSELSIGYISERLVFRVITLKEMVRQIAVLLAHHGMVNHKFERTGVRN